MNKLNNLNNLQQNTIKDFAISLIKTYQDMYLDERMKYALDFEKEYIEVKQMGYENLLDLDKILLDMTMANEKLPKTPLELEVGS